MSRISYVQQNYKNLKLFSKTKPVLQNHTFIGHFRPTHTKWNQLRQQLITSNGDVDIILDVHITHSATPYTLTSFHLTDYLPSICWEVPPDIINVDNFMIACTAIRNFFRCSFNHFFLNKFTSLSLMIVNVGWWDKLLQHYCIGKKTISLRHIIQHTQSFRRLRTIAIFTSLKKLSIIRSTQSNLGCMGNSFWRYYYKI